MSFSNLLLLNKCYVLIYVDMDVAITKGDYGILIFLSFSLVFMINLFKISIFVFPNLTLPFLRISNFYLSIENIRYFTFLLVHT